MSPTAIGSFSTDSWGESAEIDDAVSVVVRARIGMMFFAFTEFPLAFLPFEA